MAQPAANIQKRNHLHSINPQNDQKTFAANEYLMTPKVHGHLHKNPKSSKPLITIKKSPVNNPNIRT